MDLSPAGQVPWVSRVACALLGWWTRRHWRLRPELGPLAPRRPELAPVAWRGRPRVRVHPALPASQHCAGLPLCGGGSFKGPLLLPGSGAPRGSGTSKGWWIFHSDHSAVDLKARRPLRQEPLRTGLCGGSPSPDRANYWPGRGTALVTLVLFFVPFDLVWLSKESWGWEFHGRGQACCKRWKAE